MLILSVGNSRALCFSGRHLLWAAMARPAEQGSALRPGDLRLQGYLAG
jgi:hypothetical protein